MGNMRYHQTINIHFTGVPKAEEKEKGIEKLLNEIAVENVPGLERHGHPDTDSSKDSKQTQSKRFLTWHIEFKLAKVMDKQKILKTVIEKYQAIQKGKSIRLTSKFLADILQARRDWDDIFMVLKEKKFK